MDKKCVKLQFRLEILRIPTICSFEYDLNINNQMKLNQNHTHQRTIQVNTDGFIYIELYEQHKAYILIHMQNMMILHNNVYSDLI